MITASQASGLCPMRGAPEVFRGPEPESADWGKFSPRRCVLPFCHVVNIGSFSRIDSLASSIRLQSFGNGASGWVCIEFGILGADQDVTVTAPSGKLRDIQKSRTACLLDAGMQTFR